MQAWRLKDRTMGFISESRLEMSNKKIPDHYPDPTELYRRKEAHRKLEARRPVTEKMATVARLRDFERSLAETRKANRAKRAAKQIKIELGNEQQ
jgi:hypothetical protein